MYMPLPYMYIYSTAHRQLNYHTRATRVRLACDTRATRVRHACDTFVSHSRRTAHAYVRKTEKFYLALVYCTRLDTAL